MIEFTNPYYAGPYLSHFWDEADPRPAKEQANTSYVYGGWQPFSGFTLLGSEKTTYKLAYPGDPPQVELSRAKLRDEIIVLFPSAWVAIIQLDGSCEIARMD